MNAEKRAEIFRRFRADNPKPTTELEFNTPFELLAAVLLSAQATDVSVNLATSKLFPVANTPAALLTLGVGGVEQYIRTIGLFRSKAKHLMPLLSARVGSLPNAALRKLSTSWVAIG